MGSVTSPSCEGLHVRLTCARGSEGSQPLRGATTFSSILPRVAALREARQVAEITWVWGWTQVELDFSTVTFLSTRNSASYSRTFMAPTSICFGPVGCRTPQRALTGSSGDHGPRGKQWLDGLPDVLPVQQAEEAECHHVPVGAVVIAHQVQGQRHM